MDELFFSILGTVCDPRDSSLEMGVDGSLPGSPTPCRPELTTPGRPSTVPLVSQAWPLPSVLRVSLLLALVQAQRVTGRGAWPMHVIPSYPAAEDELLILTAVGLANRDRPRLWLNASSQAPGQGAGIAVDWPYAPADGVWLKHLEEHYQVM